jgi:hypothetical protein
MDVEFPNADKDPTFGLQQANATLSIAEISGVNLALAVQRTIKGSMSESTFLNRALDIHSLENVLWQRVYLFHIQGAPFVLPSSFR